MKVICCMVALLCLINKKVSSTSINVGTVLFTPSDLSKNCWSDYELSLLTARRMMQDALPEPSSIDFTNPKIISILLEYFQSCYETIGKSTCGTSQRIMYLAFSDALGGYLRACILPILRRAFYAGHVTYADARRMFQLYDDVKCYLKTTGDGWSKSQGSYGVKFHIKPLKISKTGNELACARLYLIEKPFPNSGFPGTSYIKGQLKKKFHDSFAKIQENVKKVEGLRGNGKETSAIKEPGTLLKIKNSNMDNPGSLLKLRHPNPMDPTSSLKAKHIDTEGKFTNKISDINGKGSERGSAALQKMHLKKENMLLGNRPAKEKEYGMKVSTNQMKRKRESCGDDCKPKECPENPCCKRLIVPLPILDDCQKPNAIAIPFKKHPLRSLYSRSSAFIVQRFYVTVVKCLCSRSSNGKDLLNFNAQFYSWIASEVFPRLNDEQWYPAFGGILRIVETIKQSGYDNSGKKEVSIKDPGYLYDKGVELEESEQCKSEGDFDEDETNPNKRYYILGITTISLIWLALIIYCCLWCVACRRRSKDDHCNCPCPGGPGPGPLKFIFIVRFFQKLVPSSKHKDKKQQEPAESGQNQEREVHSHSYDSQENREPKESRPRSRSSSSLRSVQKKAKLDGRGDQNIIADLTKHQYNVTLTPVWTYKSRPDEKGDAVDKIKIQDQIQMLWKKPSSEIQKDGSVTEGVTSDANEPEPVAKCTTKASTKASTTVEVEESTESSSEVDAQKVYYVEKSSNAFDYTRACPYSLKKKSTGNSSTNTQAKSDFSSTAVDLFDHIVACHNTYTNASANTFTQETDSESESERGPTSSTEESANSTTTTEKKPISRPK